MAQPGPYDGRKVGVVIHHVASMYPLEIQLAQKPASGAPVTRMTWEAVTAGCPGELVRYLRALP